MLEQLTRVGFLFQVESLLSTNGSKMGMLEDMSVAMRDLAMFSFQLMESNMFTNLAQDLTQRREDKSFPSDVYPRYK